MACSASTMPESNSDDTDDLLQENCSRCQRPLCDFVAFFTCGHVYCFDCARIPHDYRPLFFAQKDLPCNICAISCQVMIFYNKKSMIPEYYPVHNEIQVSTELKCEKHGRVNAVYCRLHGDEPKCEKCEDTCHQRLRLLAQERHRLISAEETKRRCSEVKKDIRSEFENHVERSSNLINNLSYHYANVINELIKSYVKTVRIIEKNNKEAEVRMKRGIFALTQGGKLSEMSLRITPLQKNCTDTQQKYINVFLTSLREKMVEDLDEGKKLQEQIGRNEIFIKAEFLNVLEAIEKVGTIGTSWDRNFRRSNMGDMNELSVQIKAYNTRPDFITDLKLSTKYRRPARYTLMFLKYLRLNNIWIDNAESYITNFYLKEGPTVGCPMVAQFFAEMGLQHQYVEQEPIAEVKASPSIPSSPMDSLEALKNTITAGPHSFAAGLLRAFDHPTTSKSTSNGLAHSVDQILATTTPPSSLESQTQYFTGEPVDMNEQDDEIIFLAEVKNSPHVQDNSQMETETEVLNQTAPNEAEHLVMKVVTMSSRETPISRHHLNRSSLSVTSESRPTPNRISDSTAPESSIPTSMDFVEDDKQKIHDRPLEVPRDQAPEIQKMIPVQTSTTSESLLPESADKQEVHESPVEVPRKQVPEVQTITSSHQISQRSHSTASASLLPEKADKQKVEESLVEVPRKQVPEVQTITPSHQMSQRSQSTILESLLPENEDQQNDDRIIIKIPIHQDQGVQNVRASSSPATSNNSRKARSPLVIRIKLQSEPYIVCNENEPCTSKDGEDDVQSVRSNDNHHEHCFVCNGTEAGDPELRICTGCVRVYHCDCMSPRQGQQWSTSSGDWKCTLCDTTPKSTTKPSGGGLSEQERFTCAKVLMHTYESSKAFHFRTRVPDKLDEEYQIIYHSIDLKTVGMRLEPEDSHSFKTVESFIESMNQIFKDSAVLFCNEKNKKIELAGRKVRRLFQRAVETHLPQFTGSVWCPEEHVSKRKNALPQKRSLPTDPDGSSTKSKLPRTLDEHPLEFFA